VPGCTLAGRCGEQGASRTAPAAAISTGRPSSAAPASASRGAGSRRRWTCSGIPSGSPCGRGSPTRPWRSGAGSSDSWRRMAVLRSLARTVKKPGGSSTCRGSARPAWWRPSLPSRKLRTRASRPFPPPGQGQAEDGGERGTLGDLPRPHRVDGPAVPEGVGGGQVQQVLIARLRPPVLLHPPGGRVEPAPPLPAEGDERLLLMNDPSGLAPKGSRKGLGGSRAGRRRLSALSTSRPGSLPIPARRCGDPPGRPGSYRVCCWAPAPQVLGGPSDRPGASRWPPRTPPPGVRQVY
jgi:hypothetical protein